MASLHVLGRGAAVAVRSAPSSRPASFAQQQQRASWVRGAASNDAVTDALAAAEALLAAAGGSPSPGNSQPAAAVRSADKVELRCDVNGCSIVPVSSDAPARDAPPNSFFASVDEFEAAGVSGGEGGAPRARSGRAASSTQQQASSSSPSSGAPAPVDFRLAEGPGWRLGFDAAAPPGSTNFSAVAGGDGWSAAMTRDEYDDLVRLLANLQQSVATLSVCGEWGSGGSGGESSGGGGGGDDEAALEMSSARVWVQGRAPAARLSSLQAAWAAGGAAQAAPSSPLAAFELRFILLQGREVEGVWPAEAVAGVLANLEGVAPAASAAGAGAGSSGAAAASNPVAANA